MPDIQWTPVLIRWLHVVGAVVALGGAIFMRFVLMPVAKTLPQDAHDTLRQGVRRRFALYFHLALTVLIVTGFWSYVKVEMGRHDGQMAYHALIGTKILLAFAVFFIGSALTGGAAAFEGLRKKAPRWLAINILLALAIIALAGIARAMPKAETSKAQSSKVQTPGSIGVPPVRIE